MVKSIFLKSVTSFVLLLMACELFANEISELKLEEKVSRSDAVFFGRIISVHVIDVTVQNGTIEYSLVGIQESLKGKLSGAIRVETKGGISELNPSCCVVGENYLFFLRFHVRS